MNKILISLHDVCSYHLPLLYKFQELAKTMGLTEVAYLFVPDFHNRGVSNNRAEFKSWVDSISFTNPNWFLHGYYHLETSIRQNSYIWKDFLKRKFMTAGEGEFLTLEGIQAEERIEAGLEKFKSCFPATELTGFIAPAWLYNDSLFEILKKTGLSLTENHWGIFYPKIKKEWRAPVITWATRTRLRKYGSLLVCPYLEKKYRFESYLRLAMHPHDFKHPETVQNIIKVLEKALETRAQSSYGQFLKFK